MLAAVRPRLHAQQARRRDHGYREDAASSSACAVDFTRPGVAAARAATQVNVIETYKAPNGKVNWRNTDTCVEHLLSQLWPRSSSSASSPAASTRCSRSASCSSTAARGVLNFAQGEVGTLGLFVAWWLVDDHGLPWFVGARGRASRWPSRIGVAFERFVVRRMVDAAACRSRSPPSACCCSCSRVEFRALRRRRPSRCAAPISGDGIELAGVVVSPTQMLSLVVVAGVGVGLGAVPAPHRLRPRRARRRPGPGRRRAGRRAAGPRVGVRVGRRRGAHRARRAARRADHRRVRARLRQRAVPARPGRRDGRRADQPAGRVRRRPDRRPGRGGVAGAFADSALPGIKTPGHVRRDPRGAARPAQRPASGMPPARRGGEASSWTPDRRILLALALASSSAADRPGWGCSPTTARCCSAPASASPPPGSRSTC